MNETRKPSYEDLERELGEARELIEAIRRGEVDTILGNHQDAKHLRLENLKLVEERERLIAELQEAQANIKTLQGLLPVCSWCKKIRDDQGDWNHMETYIRTHSQADFSHSICPACLEKYHPDI